MTRVWQWPHRRFLAAFLVLALLATSAPVVWSESAPTTPERASVDNNALSQLEPSQDMFEIQPQRLAASSPTGPARQRDMGFLEKQFWTAVKALASAGGATVGSAIGVTVVPAALTALVGALGISTAGTGFVAVVLIPAGPVIGQVVGSGVGAGLFSGLVAVFYEVRMQSFRPVPMTAGAIIKAVATTAATEAFVGAATMGLGGGAASAAGQSVKVVLIKILKDAGLRFAGQTVLSGLIKIVVPDATDPNESGETDPGLVPEFPEEPAPPSEGDDPDLADDDPEMAAGSVSHATGSNAFSNAPSPTPEPGTADEAMTRPMETPIETGPGDNSPAEGFSPEVEKMAQVGPFAARLSFVGSVLPGHIGAGLGMQFSIATQLFKSF